MIHQIKYIISTICLLLSIQIVSAQCNFTATSSGGNATYTQVYVLVDASNNIVAQNLTGTFNSVAEGSYQIHALNFNPMTPPNPLPADLIGQPVSDVGSTTPGCFNPDFLTDFVSKICANPSCAQTSSICKNAPIVVNSSGANAGYTQVYVLANDSGNFVDWNSTGTFASTSLTIGNTYQVHALNYNPLDAPTTLPSDLSLNDPLSNISDGCFNADFLTDYVCFNIISCDCTPTDVCENEPIVATSSGGNTGYTQVYVLADDSGNFVDQNSTGTFPSISLTTGNTYQVHALNYNPLDAPTTLPEDLNLGEPLAGITGGCFNADFLSDYVCFTIISCVCTPTAICNNASIIATSSGGNTAYTQVYVLADDSGNFVDWNSTGTFPASSLTIGAVYNVHALNYDPLNAPTTLPDDLNVGESLAGITGGCFNANFLTDIVCFEIICCGGTPGFIR